MRILIAGGRDFNDIELFNKTMSFYKNLTQTVISGTAKGADTMGELWAEDVGASVERFPALWEKHGKAAGPIRNQLMLTEGSPNLVVVFPGGAGSKSMVQKARKAGVETLTPGWEV